MLGLDAELAILKSDVQARVGKAPYVSGTTMTPKPAPSIRRGADNSHVFPVFTIYPAFSYTSLYARIVQTVVSE